MAETTLAYSAAPLKELKALQFGVIAPEQLKSYSAMSTGTDSQAHGVTTPATYDYLTGQPIIGGLSDPRLGNLDDPEDPGYFGHIELARPVYHLGFLTTVLMVLRCVGYHTHRLLIEEKDAPAVKDAQRYKGRKRLHAMVEICKNKTLDLNGRVQPKYRRENLDIWADMSKNIAAKRRRNLDNNGGNIEGEDLEEDVMQERDQGKSKLRASMALSILRDLTNDECVLLGFDPRYCRPDWLIVQVVPVPPPQVRPSISMGSGQRCEDDLTSALADIVKANLQVKTDVSSDGRSAGQAPQHVIDEHVKLLQQYVATMIDNNTPYIPRATTSGGKPLKSVRQRIVGKEGRVRGNLMGKRCDFTARSVITADPNLSIDQVGVPRSIALHLTVPERVTVFNKERLRELVRRGPYEYPGARYVLRDGLRTDLRYMHTEIPLKVGDIVERHLANDDVVLFNRQPSLHKMSIMGHRVRVLPWSTFRLNLSVTTPYNADFDGDEMNMHVPQSIMARTEAETMMMVNKVIVSPQSNRPVMGIVQDALLSCSLMTRRDVFIGKEVVMNILTWLDDFNGDIPIPAVMVPVPNRPGERECRWTGKQLFSLVVPPKINMNHTRSNGHRGDEKFEDLNPFDTWVIIEEGELLAGMVDKKSLGNSGGTLIHIVCNECGPEVARVLFNMIQRVSNYWILQRTYTVGVGDTVADKKVMDQVHQVLEDMRSGVADLVRKGQRGDLQMQPGKTIAETFEDYVNARLNQARDLAGKKAEASIPPSNGFKGTVQAGSKGSFLNIAQIMTCVGQQNVEGKRIPYGFDRRTLPHFFKDDLGPESRGFVENSYLKGLTPQEFFFHAMGGREGLIDTACKTAETGYIQRRLVKALEDCSVRYDGTVRNGRGEVVQFLYGEDGMDGGFIETATLDLLSMTASQRRDKFKFEVDSVDFGLYRDHSYLEYQVIEQIRRDPEARRVLDEEFQQLEQDGRDLRRVTYAREAGGSRFNDKQIPLPVNIARMILNAKKNWKVDETKPSDLSPDYVATKVKKLQAKLTVVKGSDHLSKEAQRNATLLFFIYLRSSLASKQLLRDHRICKDAFEWLLREIETRFFQSLVAPGEMCGVLAAQSIGEPTTQMTLNTFHQAGVSAKNATSGVPRFKEIINLSKNIKTPSLTVFLSDDVKNDRKRADEVLNRIEFTTLRGLTETVEIVYDPFPLEDDLVAEGIFTCVESDLDFVKANYQFYDEEANGGPLVPQNLGSFVLRIVLDKNILAYKKITIPEIQQKIRAQFRDTEDFELITSDENDFVPRLRLRLKHNTMNEKKTRPDEADPFEENEHEEERRLLKMQTVLLDEMVLRGIKGIPKVFIREGVERHWDDDKGFTTSKEWVLDTEGTNLLAVMAVEGVDHKRTISNDIVQTIEVLGIEAVRRAILNEIRMVFGDTYINYRHLGLLVDVMCSKGFIMAITRHGVNRAESGALMRASFEETVEILMEAAAFSEFDPVSGVSENIMLGKLAPIGSGACTLVLDEAVLAKHAIVHQTEEDDLYTMSNEALNGVRDYELGPATPGAMTPSYNAAWGSEASGAFSPGPTPGSPGAYVNSRSPGAASPSYGATSPRYSPSSPQYSPSSPAYSPSSPAYSPSSPAYSPSSPAYSPSSPAYSPSSPAYSPSSPAYSPSSPAYSPSGAAGGAGKPGPQYSPSSPNYSPSSPAYSPSSPAYSPSSPQYSPSSPQYSPSSPAYSPSSPAYSPSSPAYSPSSPAYSPSSPAYSPGAAAPAAKKNGK